MVCTSEKELSKLLKGVPPPGVYLLYGSDSSLVQRYAALLAEKAAGKDSLFDTERIDGKKLDFDHLYDSVLTLPVLAQRRCVLVDDPDIDRLTAVELDKLMQILPETGETTLLVLAVRQSPFLPKKSQKCKKVLAAADKYGVVCELGERSEADLVKFVQQRCQAAGCTIAPETAQLLVQRTTGELLAVQNEADKVIAFTGQGEVLPETVQRLVSATVEAEVYSLSKAVFAGDYARAMQLLDALFYLREPAVNILFALASGVIDLYRAKAAVFAGVDSAAAAAAFGYHGREFVLSNAMRDSKKLPLGFLKAALEVLDQADSQLKGSPLDETVVLQRAVTELFLLLKERDSY